MADNGVSDAFNPNNSSVRILKDFLRDHGVLVTGNKPQLVERVKGVIALGLTPLKEIEEADKETTNRRDLEKFKTPLGEHLPNPSSLKDWTDSVKNIPLITDNDLYNYLVLNRKRTFDNDYVKANRALKAKVFYEDRHVHGIKYHPILNECSHCFVKCKVIPSFPTQKENQKPDYDVWLCLSKVTGQVHSAGCSCSAGEGESCNHIAALLYGLVDISNGKIDGLDASTSQKCKWNEPRKRKLSPKKAQDLQFKKHKFEDKSQSVRKELFQNTVRSVKAINTQSFSQKLKLCNKHAAWLYGNDFSVPKICVDEEYTPSLHQIDFMYSDKVKLNTEPCLSDFTNYFNNLSISESDCVTIERQTRGQNKSCHCQWQKARVGRITSSNFGLVFKHKDSTPPENLTATLLNYNAEVNTASIRWGRSHEAAARRVYTKKLTATHSSLEVTECGLCINSTHPHLGSSPDGLVTCTCHGKGLVEIKCPFKYRFLTPTEASKDRTFYCESINGKLKLKRKHSYFFQVQGQMAICQRTYCGFYVWTLKGDSVERIVFDRTFWETCVHKINTFYIYAIIPELFSERVKRTLKLY